MKKFLLVLIVVLLLFLGCNWTQRVSGEMVYSGRSELILINTSGIRERILDDRAEFRFSKNKLIFKNKQLTAYFSVPRDFNPYHIGDGFGIRAGDSGQLVDLIGKVETLHLGTRIVVQTETCTLPDQKCMRDPYNEISFMDCSGFKRVARSLQKNQEVLKVDFLNSSFPTSPWVATFRGVLQTRDEILKTADLTPCQGDSIFLRRGQEF